MSVLLTEENHVCSLLRDLTILRVLVVAPAAVVATIGLLWGMERLIRAESFMHPEQEIYRVPDPVMVEPPPLQVLYDRPSPPEKVELEPQVPDLEIDLGLTEQILMPPPTSVPPVTRPGVSASFGDLPVATMLVQPQYPAAAASRGIEGNVDVEFDVTETGATTNVRVLEAVPPRIFEKETINAVKRWKFTPVMRDGRPVAYSGMTHRVNFQMEKKQN